jgi:hypothetical protein
LALTVLVAATMVGGIVRINHAWPNVRTAEAAAGDSLDAGGARLTVEETRWVSGPELPAFVPGYVFDMTDTTGGPLPLADQAMVVVNLTLRNDNTVPTAVDLRNWYLESAAWRNGLDLPAFQLLNPGQSPSVSLEASDTVTVELAYSLYSFQFKPGQWLSAPARDFELVQLAYPDKKLLELSFAGV